MGWGKKLPFALHRYVNYFCVWLSGCIGLFIACMIGPYLGIDMSNPFTVIPVYTLFFILFGPSLIERLKRKSHHR